MMIVIVDLFLISGTEKSFHHTLRIMDRHALDHIHHLQCYEGHRSVKGFQELCDSLYFLFYGFILFSNKIANNHCPEKF